MSLWRAELWRITRTKRWLALVLTFGLLGIFGPVTARYLPILLGQIGTDQLDELGSLQSLLPAPTVVSAFIQYTSNASQIGVLTVAVVAGMGLSIDNDASLASFYRTRSAALSWLIGLRAGVTMLAAGLGSSLGIVTTWLLTAALLERPSALTLWGGILTNGVYFAFIVGLAATGAAMTRRTVMGVFVALGTALAVPALGIFSFVRDWLPSKLAGAPADLAAGMGLSDFLPALVAASVLTPLLVWWSATRLAAREG